MNFLKFKKITLTLGLMFFFTISAPSWSTHELIAENSMQLTKSNKVVIGNDDFISEYNSEYNTAPDKKLYFVMSLLTDKNYDCWEKFLADQAPAGLRIWNEIVPNGFASGSSIPNETQKFLKRVKIYRPGEYSVQAGLCAFEKSLNIHKASKSKNSEAEIWIAYAVRDDENKLVKPITSADFSDIEMAVTILTNKKSPFTVQMGITRTVYCEEKIYKNNLVKTPQLSILLSAFAAKAMQKHDPSKIWVMTSPATPMDKIFEKFLPKESYYKYEFFSKAIHRTADGLTVYDYEGKKVFFVSDSDLQDSSWDFFRHRYLTELTRYAFNCNYLLSRFNTEVLRYSSMNEAS